MWVTDDPPVIDLGQSELTHQGHVPSPGTALMQRLFTGGRK